MSTAQRSSPSVENVDGGDAAVVLPASMQTLLDRYTERPLTTAERLTLARATPNVRCEALRLFFEMNDAAAAVAFVLRHGGATPASSTQRQSENRRHSQSSTASSVQHSGHNRKSTTSSNDAARAKKPARPSPAGHAALQPLALNTPNTSSVKPNTEVKQDVAAQRDLLDAPESPQQVGGVVNAESPAPTPLKQRLLRPPSLSATGGPASGSRPRRFSATRRGESMCTLVTVSSMSDEDAPEVEEQEDHAMPPTVTLRSHEGRSSSSTAAGAAAAVPQVPALVLDAVLKPNSEPVSAAQPPRSNASSPTAAAPGRPTRRSSTPQITAAAAAAAVVAVAATGRDESPSVLPPPGAQRIAPSTSPSAATAAGAAEEGGRRTVAAKPHGTPPPRQQEGVSEQPTLSTTDVAEAAVEEPQATAPPLPTPAAHQPTNRPTQHHHVGFTDATALTVLEAYRKNGVPPLGYRDEVELAYTELSCGHSSASPSCAAPSVVSGGRTAADGVPKRAMDWAALVASVRGPQGGVQVPANSAAAGKPAVQAVSSPRKERKTAAATPAASALRTPRRTPRGSQEDVVRRRSSGDGSTVKKPVQQQQQQQPSSSRATHKKRLSGQEKEARTVTITTPEKTQRVRSANASPLKRGVAWDDTTKTYVTHPNQLRRQLAAAEAAAAVAAVAPTPAATPTLAVRAAGASALETPDVLHAYFGRTASTAVVATDAGADGNGGAVATPRVLQRTPTATGAPTGGAVGFGRLCSSALHLSKPSTATTEALKTPRTARTSKAAATPPPSATPRLLSKKRAATAATRTPAPVLASPRPAHNATAKAGAEYARLRSGYAAPDALAAAQGSGFQRLRSSYVAPHDVYREGGEVIQLQRQASQFHGHVYPSTEALRRMASGVAMNPTASRVDPMSAPAEIQPAGYVYCPSTIRSPRTARMPHEGEGGAAAATAAAVGAGSGWTSARGPLYNRSASGYHHHQQQQHPHHLLRTHTTTATTEAAATVPPPSCGVFERLTSNFYGVYASAAALLAPPPAATLASPRGQRSHNGAGASSSSAVRRRNTSAPVGRRGALKRGGAGAAAGGARNLYPPMREGWLSPDGKVAATQRASSSSQEEEEARGSAPTASAFMRTNTSRYLNLSK